MTPNEILKQAREFLSDPNRWFKGDFANGYSDPGLADPRIPEEFDRLKKPEFTCFCALGAVYRVSPTVDDAERTIRTLADRNGLPSIYEIPEINDADETTHADVLALFDKAIEE